MGIEEDAIIGMPQYKKPWEQVRMVERFQGENWKV